MERFDEIYDRCYQERTIETTEEWEINLVKAGFESAFNWISVDDRLPELLTQNLIYCKTGEIKHIEIGYFTKIYEGNEEFILLPFPNIKLNVTHWMSLPDEPKE